jgi:hypothetical protein
VDAPLGGGAPSIISSSDLHHFPSLGGLKAQDAAGTPAKLNFKEMMMRTSTATATATSTSTATATSTSTSTSTSTANIPVVMYSKQSTNPQKSLSSNNIFLAAFHNPDHDDDDDDDDDECNVANNSRECGSGSAPGFVSSVLIDSCDKKYDRLYR